MDAAEAGDASLKHSSCIWVTGWFQAGFQKCLDDDDALSSFYGISFFWGAWGFCCQRVVSLAVISWRGGGRFIDPVEVAFQRRPGHIFIYCGNELMISNHLTR